jgi:tetratricopeptide (TPR) repeat protein
MDLTYALSAYKLTRFAYRRYFRPLEHKYERLFRNLVAKHHAWKNKPRRPPTKKESADAVTQMRLVHKYLADMDIHIETSRNAGMNMKEVFQYLSPATRALARARKLDPAAIMLDAEEFPWTQDMMAASLLFHEADGYYSHGLNYPEYYGDYGIYDKLFSIPSYNQAKRKYEKQNYRRAIIAIERALEFQPHAIRYMRFQAHMYDLLGKRRKAREIVARALELDRDDLETHQLWNHLHDET